MIRDDEILTGPSPFDQVRYARMADSLMQHEWLGGYDALTLVRHPGYPLWIWLSGLFGGIPLRIAAELLLCASGLALALALVRSGFPPWLGLVAHAAVVMHPDSFGVDRQLLSESLYAPVLVLAVASALRLLRADEVRQRLAHAAVLGVWLAILWQTRPERILVMLFLLSLGVLLAGARLAHGRRGFIRGLSTALAPPLLLLAASSLAVSWTNRAWYGVATSSELFSPGFSALQDGLVSIRAGPSRRYVAIPETSRRLAYAASPALRELETALEGELKPLWTRGPCRDLGICDDYVNGKLLFALREAAARAGYHRTAPAAEAFYSRAAAELRAACGRGTIPCRRPPLPYVRADLLPHLPAAALQALALFAPRVVPPEPEADAEEIRDLFDRVARRRTPPRGGFRIAGWAWGEGEPVSRVALVDASGRILAQTTELLPRPDVSRHFAASGSAAVPERSGFSLSGTTARDAPPLSQARFLFFRASGPPVEAPVRPGGGSLPVRYGVDLLLETPAVGAPAPPGPGFILACRTAAVVLFLAALLSVIVILALGRRSAVLRTLWPAPALIGAVVAGRAAFVILVHAFLFPAAGRYLYPVLGLSVAGAVLVIWIAARMLAEPRAAEGSPAAPAQ